MNYYVRHSVVSIQAVFEAIAVARESFSQSLRMPKKHRVEINDEMVNIFSTRLKTFYEHGTECSKCGLSASFFAIERNLTDEKNNAPYHLNLYGVKDGEEILFTHDHTLARALGGAPHSMDNTSTMCQPCNTEKSIGEQKLAEQLKKEQKLAEQLKK